MKKIFSIILAIMIMFLPSNILAKSDDLNSTEMVVQEILNNESISKETKEWLNWFNSLSAEDQQYISYRPFELDGYKYEKEYIDNNINSNNFSEINTKLFGDKVVLPMGKIPDNLGSKILPVGGYEIKYNPTYWNNNRLRANCYTYALNYLATKNRNSQQPGYASGKKITIETMSATNIINAVKKDVNHISNVKGFRKAAENEKPGYREYKVALVIAPGVDYHWYKQDSDGYWSHKRGVTNITRADASGRSIINPRLANRNYGRYNYSVFVGYYFVKY